MGNAPTIADGRRPKGWLAKDIDRICQMFITGEIELPDDKHLTPHRAAMLLKEIEQLDKAPSSGAVSAVFRRWQTYGYAVFIEDPFAFLDFTEKGRLLGLDGILQERARARKMEAQDSD